MSCVGSGLWKIHGTQDIGRDEVDLFQGKEITVTVTCQKLMTIAECSCRMTEYAEPDGSRLITIMDGQDGTPVRLVLDRQCILNGCKNSGLFKTCKKNLLQAMRQYNGNIPNPDSEVVACLELASLQKPEKKQKRHSM